MKSCAVGLPPTPHSPPPSILPRLAPGPEVDLNKPFASSIRSNSTYLITSIASNSNSPPSPPPLRSAVLKDVPSAPCTPTPFWAPPVEAIQVEAIEIAEAAPVGRMLGVAGVAGADAPELGWREVGGRAREEVGGRAGRKEVGGRARRKDVDGRAGKDVLERERPNDVGGKIAAEKEEVLNGKIVFLTRFASSSLPKNGASKNKKYVLCHENTFLLLSLSYAGNAKIAMNSKQK